MPDKIPHDFPELMSQEEIDRETRWPFGVWIAPAAILGAIVWFFLVSWAFAGAPETSPRPLDRPVNPPASGSALDLSCAETWDRNDVVTYWRGFSLPRHECKAAYSDLNASERAGAPSGAPLDGSDDADPIPDPDPGSGPNPDPGENPGKPGKPDKPGKGPPDREGCNGRGCAPGSGKGQSEGREQSKQDGD